MDQPTTPAAVTPGMGATMHYPSDSVAMVVTRTTAKSIFVARVETAEPELDMRSDEGAWGLRPTNAEGILDKIIPGTEQRLTFRQGKWRNGYMTYTLGYSVSRRDWRD